MEPELRALVDKHSIMELCWQYSRACDRLDRCLLERTYWPDGSDDHGTFKGSAPDYVDWVMELLGSWISSQHDNSNFLIELDGDDAYGEVHWTGYYSFRIKGVAHDQLSAGRYLDHYQRRAGEWRILHRSCVSEWSRIEAAEQHWREHPVRGLLVGTRGRDDLVYRLRELG